MRRNALKIFTIAIVVCWSLSFLQSSLVYAHARLQSASILPNSILTANIPSTLTVSFTQDTTPSETQLQVLDGAGNRVDKADLQVSGANAKISLNTLADGKYIVKFRSFTSDDNGITEGQYFFIVAQNDPVYKGSAETPVNFPPTGFNLSGQFLTYWRVNGGLSVFGYPISSEQQVNGFTAQWLERNRFELHPENNAPYNVLLGLLGVEALAKKGIKWQTLPTVTVDNTPDGCRFFKETGHSLCSDFKKYWEQNGLRFDPNSNLVYSYQESLALFGYPISEPKVETNSSGDQVLTQWFERARFELHPNNPEIFKVELGLLGNELKP